MKIEMAEMIRAKASEGMDVQAYAALFEQVVAEGRTTGPVQTEDLVAYTKLNLSRWRRVTKTMKLLPEVEAMLKKAVPQTWIVISEAWCGDAAQVGPIIANMAAASPNITLRMVLRDEHPDLMDRFLTNGGRSIPKLIAIDDASDELIFSWGPRPKAAQELVNAIRDANGGDTKAAAEDLHRWYHADDTKSTQLELLPLIRTS